MNDLVIEWGKAGEETQRVSFGEKTLLIGRAANCTLRLRGWGIAREHALIFKIDAQSYIRDLGGIGGVRVNGERVRDFGPLSKNDSIEIGSYILRVASTIDRANDPNKHLQSGPTSHETSTSTNSAPPLIGPTRAATCQASLVCMDRFTEGPDTTEELCLPSADVTRAKRPELALGQVDRVQIGDCGSVSPELLMERDKRLASHVSWLRAALLAELERQGTRVDRMSHDRLEDDLAGICKSLLSPERCRNADLSALSSSEQLGLIRATLDECLGLGPIQALLNDPEISEIMVNGPSTIFVERHGQLRRISLQFSSEQSLRQVAERIASQVGRRLDLAAPTLDARLHDGSRVNLVLPPLATQGTHITIRKFSRRMRSLSDLVSSRGASPALASFLAWAVQNRLNLLVVGGTGSGKTTLLNMLASEIPHDQRVITIEDAAELQFDHPHCVTLEARAAGHEGSGCITIRDLLRNALRMRPDRIMIGECRGGEALDLLQALNTGHGGSMSTIHANSPREALGRLEVLTLLAGLDLPVDAVRGQIASAFQLVVQTRRFEDGSRKVCCVSELTGLEGGRYRMQDLFQLDMDSGIASQDYRSCLSTPSCIETTIGVVKRPWIEHFQNDRFVHEQQSSHANAAGDDRRMGSSLLAADLGQLAKVAA